MRQAFILLIRATVVVVASVSEAAAAEPGDSTYCALRVRVRDFTNTPVKTIVSVVVPTRLACGENSVISRLTCSMSM
jgi:hypothetical protein